MTALDVSSDIRELREIARCSQPQVEEALMGIADRLEAAMPAHTPPASKDDLMPGELHAWLVATAADCDSPYESRMLMRAAEIVAAQSVPETGAGRLEALQQARLTWAMACPCSCPACELFHDLIRDEYDDAKEGAARMPCTCLTHQQIKACQKNCDMPTARPAPKSNTDPFSDLPREDA